jgi:hypothetical protein
MPREPFSIRATCKREGTTGVAVGKRGPMEDPLEESLAWLFVKTDEEILAEAEVAVLHSMFLVEDTRPERAGSNG